LITPGLHELVDDEYARAGIEDPKVFLTTSRDPSSRLSQFCKELKLVFPNAERMNRGNHTTGQILDVCKTRGVTDIIIVHETRGEPGTNLNFNRISTEPNY
jgi:U3 small nucleolar ribonucleoprotein protein IMP4